MEWRHMQLYLGAALSKVRPRDSARDKPTESG